MLFGFGLLWCGFLYPIHIFGAEIVETIAQQYTNRTKTFEYARNSAMNLTQRQHCVEHWANRKFVREKARKSKSITCIWLYLYLKVMCWYAVMWWIPFLLEWLTSIQSYCLLVYIYVCELTVISKYKTSFVLFNVARRPFKAPFGPSTVIYAIVAAYCSLHATHLQNINRKPHKTSNTPNLLTTFQQMV